MSPEPDDDLEPPPEDDDNDDTFMERIEGAVASGFTRAAEALGLKAPTTEPEPEEPEVEPTPAPARTAAAREESTEATVRRVLEDLHDRDEIKKRVAAVEEKTAEKPPVKVRRLTRAMWG